MTARPQDANAQADSQAWPQRTVRFIVPFGPGSAADTVGRLLSERLQKTWGQPVIVENRAGGDGLVSIGAFVSAKDDHTLLLTPSTLFLVHPYVHANLPYDIDRDFRPIAWLSNTPIVVAVTATLPVNTMKEFVDYAKSKEGGVNYSISGGFLEFVWDGFRREHSVPMAKVPFRDITKAPMDLGEGRIDVLMTSYTTHRPQIQAGKTKVLVVCDPKRSDVVPDVPSVVEAGFPNLQAPSLNVLFGPAHMPLQLRQRVAKDAAAALKDEDIAQKLRLSGQEIVAGGPEQLAVAIDEQNEQVARIAKVLGVSKKK